MQLVSVCSGLTADGGSSGPPLSQILACRALLRKLSEEPYEHRGSLLSLTFCALLAVFYCCRTLTVVIVSTFSVASLYICHSLPKVLPDLH
jgi:hypothetical protein